MTTPVAQVRLGSLLDMPMGALADIMVRDVTLDSRNAAPGSIFIAVPGYEADGRAYIQAALDAGVSAVFAEAEGFSANDARVILVPQLRSRCADIARKFYADPSAEMSLLAVTGTNGKTSVTDYIAQILSHLGVAAACLGTLGARFGGGAPVSDTRNTTPDIFTLNAQLRQWCDAGVDHVALEASSHALHQGRLDGLQIQVAVFTNLSRDHLDYHGDEAAYCAAKLKLFTWPTLKTSIFNADDQAARQVVDVSVSETLGISLQYPDADVYVAVVHDDRLQRIQIRTPRGVGEFSSHLVGAFNAFNLAAAVMAVLSLGYEFAAVLSAAAAVKAVPGRMQSVANKRQLNIVIDYAHTPDAITRALQALRPQTAGAIWLVFGCGGDRDTGKRQQMGSAAEAFADRVVLTSDNPRNENPLTILTDVRSGIAGDCDVIADRRDAIQFALARAVPGDCVLIAGKGHEEYQEIKGVRHPFNDAEVVASLLAGIDACSADQVVGV